MKEITNIEVITSIYKTWKPSNLAFIKAIDWSVDNLKVIFYSQIRSTVIKWPDTSKEFIEISIRFENVQNLKLDFKGRGIQQLLGFDILDISGNSWEKINFQIEDYENGSIDFSCEDVIIDYISKPLPEPGSAEIQTVLLKQRIMLITMHMALHLRRNTRVPHHQDMAIRVSLRNIMTLPG